MEKYIKTLSRHELESKTLLLYEYAKHAGIWYCEYCICFVDSSEDSHHYLCNNCEEYVCGMLDESVKKCSKCDTVICSSCNYCVNKECEDSEE